MKSLRSIWSVVVLSIAISGVLSETSHAQTIAKGQFKLEHEVHWQNALVPPGDYSFYVRRSGGAEFLMLERAGAGATGFFLMVPASRPASAPDIDQVVIVFRGDRRFVSSMELSQYGIGLDFSVPQETMAIPKQSARAGTGIPGQSE